MLNVKPIKEEKFSYKKNTGEIVIITNHYIIQTFLDTANKSELSNVQQMLNAEKFSVKSINDFAKFMGQNITNGKMI